MVHPVRSVIKNNFYLCPPSNLHHCGQNKPPSMLQIKASQYIIPRNSTRINAFLQIRCIVPPPCITPITKKIAQRLEHSYNIDKKSYLNKDFFAVKPIYRCKANGTESECPDQGSQFCITCKLCHRLKSVLPHRSFAYRNRYQASKNSG